MPLNSRPPNQIARSLLLAADDKTLVAPLVLGFGAYFSCCNTMTEGCIESPPVDPKTLTKEELGSAGAMLLTAIYSAISQHRCGREPTGQESEVRIHRDGEIVPPGTKH